MKYNKIFTIAALSAITLMGCNKLEEKFNDSITTSSSGTVNVSDLLRNIYRGDMRALQNQDNFWAIQEHSTDECVGHRMQKTMTI